MSWSRLQARTALIAPLALAATACDRVCTAANYRDDATPPAFVSVPPRRDVVSAWQSPPGSPWAAYQKLTLFSVMSDGGGDADLPDVRGLEDVTLARAAGAAMALAGVPEDAALFVDLRGAASIAFAEQINLVSRVRLAPIPTFNNWPAEDELVPAEETLSAAITMAPPPAFDPAARPMFVLDSWRLAYKEYEVPDDVTDNRYALGGGDFPSAEALAAQGIRRVIYVVAGPGRGAQEEDDLNDLFMDYDAHGIEIAIVGTDDMLFSPRSWWDGDGANVTVYGGGGWWRRGRFHPHHRSLVVNSPHFHIRARGGWGGALAVPGGGGIHFGHGGG